MHAYVYICYEAMLCRHADKNSAIKSYNESCKSTKSKYCMAQNCWSKTLVNGHISILALANLLHCHNLLDFVHVIFNPQLY